MSNFLIQFLNAIGGHHEHCAEYDAFIERGRDFAEQEQNDEALQEYNAAIALLPQRTEGYAARASLYDAIGEYEKSIEDYNTLLTLVPKNTSNVEARMMVEAHLAKKLRKS